MKHKDVARRSRNQNPSRECRYSRFRVIRGQQTCQKNKKLRHCVFVFHLNEIEPGHRKYAMRGVSVSGLSSVDKKTAFVTNVGATSNSTAKIVVTTATGIDASMTPACRAAPDTPRNDARPSATIGATMSDSD